MKLWIRIDVAIRSDPNVAELASRLHLKRAEAVGLCTLVWAAIAEHRPNGDLTGITIPAIEDWACFEPRKGQPTGAFGAAFLELFVSDAEASGWHERQGYLVEKAEKERARKTPRKHRGNSAPTERNGTERDATERNTEIQESVATSQGSLEPTGELPASLVSALPSDAKKLLTLFYEAPAMSEAMRKRYRNVGMQLVDALDPKHPGPKIRGGQRSKARSAEHLAEVCRDVMANPPMDRDMAVVWVLKKLLDPPKGPSPTDVAKQKDTALRQVEERYHAAARAAGVLWAKEHPDKYKPILTSVEAHYRGQAGGMANLAKEMQLTQQCADAAGFPSFEDWQAAGERVPVTADA